MFNEKLSRFIVNKLLYLAYKRKDEKMLADIESILKQHGCKIEYSDDGVPYACEV